MDYLKLNKTSGGAKETVRLNKAQINVFADTIQKGIQARELEIENSKDPNDTYALASQNKFAKEFLDLVNGKKGFIIESE